MAHFLGLSGNKRFFKICLFFEDICICVHRWLCTQVPMEAKKKQALDAPGDCGTHGCVLPGVSAETYLRSS